MRTLGEMFGCVMAGGFVQISHKISCSLKLVIQVLLTAGNASKVTSETPDTRMVLMDGEVVKSHRVILLFLCESLKSDEVGCESG